MPRERPEEIFLSHSSADHDFALRLSQRVRAHGIPVWFSQTDIAGSQQWQNEIGLALERCDWFAMQERKFKGKDRSDPAQRLRPERTIVGAAVSTKRRLSGRLRRRLP